MQREMSIQFEPGTDGTYPFEFPVPENMPPSLTLKTCGNVYKCAQLPALHLTDLSTAMQPCNLAEHHGYTRLRIVAFAGTQSIALATHGLEPCLCMG